MEFLHLLHGFSGAELETCPAQADFGQPQVSKGYNAG